jgi:hypothetical protein
MDQTLFWQQLNAELDYAFLICFLIAATVILARWLVGPSRRLAFDRYAIALAGGMLIVSLGAQWLTR